MPGYMPKSEFTKHVRNGEQMGVQASETYEMLRSNGWQIEGDPNPMPTQSQSAVVGAYDDPFDPRLPGNSPPVTKYSDIGKAITGTFPAIGGIAGSIAGGGAGLPSGPGAIVSGAAGASVGTGLGVMAQKGANEMLGIAEDTTAAQDVQDIASQAAIGGLTELGSSALLYGASKIAGSAAPLAEKLYQSALKPSKAVTRKFPDVVQTGIKEGIILSNGSIDDVAGMIDDIDLAIASRIDDTVKAGGNNAVIPIDDVLTRLDDTKKFFGQTIGGSKYVDQLDNLAETFRAERMAAGEISGIPVDKAQELKRNTYQLLRKAYGELKSAETEGMKDLARGLKEEIASRVPEIAQLNAKQSKLIGLDAALADFARRNANKEIIGLAPGVGVGVGSVKDGMAGAIKGGFIAKLIKGVFDDPTVKSALAIGIDKLSSKMTISQGTKDLLGIGARSMAQAMANRGSK